MEEDGLTGSSATRSRNLADEVDASEAMVKTTAECAVLLENLYSYLTGDFGTPTKLNESNLAKERSVTSGLIRRLSESQLMAGRNVEWIGMATRNLQDALGTRVK